MGTEALALTFLDRLRWRVGPSEGSGERIVLPHPRRKSPRVKSFAAFFSYRYESAPMTKIASCKPHKGGASAGRHARYRSMQGPRAFEKNAKNQFSRNHRSALFWSSENPGRAPPFGFRILASALPVTSKRHCTRSSFQSPVVITTITSSFSDCIGFRHATHFVEPRAQGGVGSWRPHASDHAGVAEI